MNKTKIEWCDFTWNPVVGCTGSCAYCYARRISTRFHRDFTPHWVESNFNRSMPRKPSRIFVNSMSDLADWEGEWCYRVWCRIAENPEHRFLFLSKRPWECEWQGPGNAMLGYTITTQRDIERRAERWQPGVSFFSIEPILGPVNLEGWLPRWVIVGAETGNRKERKVPDLAWLVDIFVYCRGRRIPLFFKESLRTLWATSPGANFPQEFPA